ncbi:unnamed protein product [Rotaria sordida]|uniref:Uncharacterized protein n=1 Tax=Rotaria sordida TaxID=392033 RepID=A0A815HVG2_9BILA|nr:unnamed protein product [Rotaria sordida]
MSSYNALAAQRKSPACCSTDHNSSECTQTWSCRVLYHRVAGMKMYLEDMSPSFYGKTYTESALICFKLRVMLLAVEMRRTDEHGHMGLMVDVVPCDNCVITRGSRAFVVGISSEDANRVKYYCSTCYPVLDKLTESQLKHMRKCAHIIETDDIHDEETFSFDQSPNIQDNEHAIM